MEQNDVWMDLYQRAGHVLFDTPEHGGGVDLIKAQIGLLIAMDALATLASKQDEPDFKGYDSFNGALDTIDWHALLKKVRDQDDG